MPKPAPEPRVPCTFAGCHQVFKSVQEMKNHKIRVDEHEYCRRCDKDFEDEERLLIHKILSDDHIVCPICGIEFRSVGGRDGHIRQNHRSSQSLICPGCHHEYRSASGLMRHIEEGECDVITEKRLLQEQAKRVLIKRALNEGLGENKPLIPSSSDFDDIEGGVKLDGREFANREAMANQPSTAHGDPTSRATAMLALKHWPKIGNTDSRGDLMNFSEVSYGTASDGTTRGKETAMSILDSEATHQPQKPGNFGLGFLPDAGQTLRALEPSWDPTKYFNSYTGEYRCGCGRNFLSVNLFEEHVLGKCTAKRVWQCTCCFKIFKSGSALIAHCESPSTRCQVNTLANYGSFIDEVSGGAIQTSGYHTDGTIKYEGGQLQLEDTKTIGTDLSKRGR